MEQSLDFMADDLRHVAGCIRAAAAGDDRSMGSMEEQILQQTRQIQRRLLEEASQIACDGTPPRCPRCQGALSRVTRGHERTIESRFGPIVIRRSYGYCARCEQWFFPADFALGLDKNAGASPSVAEAAALTVSKMPAPDAAAVLERLTGIKIPPATLERQARREGKKALEKRDKMDEKACDPQGRWAVTNQIGASLPREPFTVVIEIDAWNVREREAGWGKKPAERAAAAEKAHAWHYVWGATVFRLGERVQKDGSKRAIIASRGTVMTRGGADALGRQTFAEAVRQGMMLAEHVLVVADGALWIWNMVGDRFSFAKQRLDFYHASQHLWAVANEIHGADTPQAKAWVEPLLHQLRHGGEAGVLETLDDLCAAVGETHKELVEREAAYFEKNKERLDYENGAKQGEPIGSGAMESTCRQYQCRFKRPGQFWTTEGDEALMALETFWRNGRWQILYPHAAQPDHARN